MAFWKEQPNRPVAGQFTTIWDGDDFCILRSGTVILRLRGSDGAVLAALPDGAITEDMLAAGSVVEAKIGAGAVTETKIGAGAVVEAKIGAGAVTEAKLAVPTAVGLNAARVARIPFTQLTTGTVASGTEIPDNAIIIGGLYHVTTAYTDAAGAARLSFQANVAEDLLADTATGTLLLDALVPIIPVFTAATSVLTTAARDISVRVGGADFTAGAGVLYLYYVVTG